MTITFPALVPSSRSFDAGGYPVLEGRSRDGSSYPRLLGSQPFDAQLSLQFRNITDDQGALLLSCYRSSRSGFHPLTLPPEAVAGISDSALSSRIRNGGAMVWRWLEPPSVDSVVPGICTVQVRLGGTLELSQSTAASPNAFAPGVSWTLTAVLTGGEANAGIQPVTGSAWTVTASFTGGVADIGSAWLATISFTGGAADDGNINIPDAAWSVTASLSGGTVTAEQNVSVDGTAWSTSAAFTGGTAGGTTSDPSFSSVPLLLHLDGSNGSTTFSDSSSSPKTVTPYGNAQISTTQSKFGGASALFDGSGDYLDITTSTALDFGTGNLTIECFAYFLSYSTYPNGAYGNVFSQRGDSGITWRILPSGKLSFFYGYGTAEFGSATTIPLNTWVHIALTREGSYFKHWLNGALDGTSGAITASMSSTVITRIGASSFSGAPGEWLNGYLDEYRITNGIARYTGSSYTVPTAAFPNS